MNILNKLLQREVQIKNPSDIDVKALQKKLKKKGVKCSIEELEQRIEEYEKLLEEERIHKVSFMSFIATIATLLLLALELQLRKMNVFVLTDMNHIIVTVMGFFVIGIVWLRCLLQAKKKYKISRILTIATIVILIGMTVAMFII